MDIMQRTYVFHLSLAAVMFLSIGCLPESSGSDSKQGDLVDPAATTAGSGGQAAGTTMSASAGGEAMEMVAPEPPAKCERKGLTDAEITVQRVKNGLEYVAEIDGDNGKSKMVVTVYQSQDFIGPTSPGYVWTV